MRVTIPAAHRAPPVRGEGKAHLSKVVVPVFGVSFPARIADSGLW